MRISKFLSAITVVLCWLLSCTLIDDIGPQDNPFDPNGNSNGTWTKSQVPVIVDSTLDNPLWSSYSIADSTGSVTLDIYAYDPDEPIDTVTVAAALSTNNISFTIAEISLGDSTLSLHNLKRNTVYYYKVIASDLNLFNKNDTASGSFTTPLEAGPQPVKSFELENLSTGIYLHWSCELNQPKQTRLYRSISLEGPYTLLKTVTVDTQYIDTSADWSLYYYLCATFNDYGEVFYPETLSGRMYNSSLTTPYSPSWNGVEDDLSITITFYKPSSSIYTVEGYEIYRALKASGPYKKVGDVKDQGSSSYSFTDAPVPTTNDYYYKYSYYTGMGSSPFSLSTSAHTARLDAPSFRTVSAGVYPDYVKLEWNGVTGATGYLLYRYNNYWKSDTILVDSITADTIYTDSIKNDSIYSYLVAAYNSRGKGDNSYPWNGYIMKKPFNLMIDTTNTTFAYISLLWTSDESYRNYIIYRSADSSIFLPRDTIYSYYTSCTWSDSTIVHNDYSRYYYRVCKQNTSTLTVSLPSKIIGATLAPDSLVDTLKASAYPDSVVLKWGHSPGATHYRIYRAYYQWASSKSQFTLADTTSDTTYTILDELDTTMYYKVTGINSSSESPWQYTYGLTVTGMKIPLTGTLYTVGSASHIKITFNNFTGALRYLLYRTTDTLGSLSFIDTADSQTYFDTVPSASTYYYKARGINWAGSSGYSPFSAGAKRLPPGTTDSISASDGVLSTPDVIKISWRRVAGADSYILFRANANTGVENYTTITTTIDSNYADNVTSDTCYYYRVKAVNAAGEGSISTIYDYGFRRPAVVPDSLVSLSASNNSSTYIYLSFTAPDSGANYNGFIIYRSLTTDSLGSYSVLDTVNSGSYNFYDYTATMTSPNKTWYKVAAYNILGQGPPKGPVWGWKL